MQGKGFILFMLAFVVFTDCVDFMMIMPLGSTLMSLFDISPAQYSLLVSSYTIAAGIAAFFAALSLDLFDRRKALIFIYFGFSAGTLLCSFADSFVELMIYRSVTGAFGGMMNALVIAIISDVFSYEKRGRALGIVMAAFSVASVAGVPMGLVLAENSGWYMPYRILGIVAFVGCALMPFALPELKGHLVPGAKMKSPSPFLKEVVADKNQVVTLLMILFMIIGHFMMVPFIPAYLVNNVGYKQEDLLYIYVVGGIVTMITSPLVGIFTDRFGAKKVYMVALLLSFIPVLVISHLTPESLPGVLVVTGVYFIFANARMIPANTMATGAVNATQRGSFMSLRSALVELGAGMAAAAAGLIIVQQSSGKLLNFDYVGYLAVFCSMISLYFAWQVKKVAEN